MGSKLGWTALCMAVLAGPAVAQEPERQSDRWREREERMEARMRERAERLRERLRDRFDGEDFTFRFRSLTRQFDVEAYNVTTSAASRAGDQKVVAQ